jgi:hypothetical protein
MFSLGVTMYQLITGKLAFGDDSIVTERIVKKPVSFKTDVWDNVSD